MSGADAAEDMTLTLADNLRLVRLDRGFSQRELATICGIHQGHLSHFERARRQPLLHNLARLAVALDCTTDLLLGLVEMPLDGRPIPRRKKVAR